ncbi:DNA oxidative demethylase AlkB [Pseudohongiella sp.]|uniref:Fe2OG dioxygenase domain-containing protein n=1 Tax=marine sediment metagenome TaxID=412755 RepID=A0A0F9VV02_9ZZZZ|nr:DNA oxidative demethylase AlkB [Pseudohongiella sp.]HDZ08590.1 DNA oxidative demethylase AlkB [Pseudohongiella sp.]HEA64080.1 DNA oxidative demethylase AlkB [Pseudohongiella sp.]
MQDLFDIHDEDGVWQEALGSGATWIHGFLVAHADEVMAEIDRVVAQAPYRHLSTPGGKRMSVAMSNCGAEGWVSDRAGYRYQTIDPLTATVWPAMPARLRALAQQAAGDGGYPGFEPTVCLINYYAPGARMGLHQDRDEANLTAPIVSFSLGLPATFIWGGWQRVGKTQRIMLRHGDAVVWGGEDRLRFHGVAPLKDGEHAVTGRARINLTFRQTK